MRERLLELIEQTKEMESFFHSTFIPEGIAMTPGEVIYDIQDFRVWVQELKLELQMVYDTTKNKFIWDTLNDLSVNFNGWDDRRKFNQIKGDLLAIKRNIDYYYPFLRCRSRLRTAFFLHIPSNSNSVEKNERRSMRKIINNQ